jgi:hypothetical protein
MSENVSTLSPIRLIQLLIIERLLVTYLAKIRYPNFPGFTEYLG